MSIENILFRKLLETKCFHHKRENEWLLQTKYFQHEREAGWLLEGYLTPNIFKMFKERQQGGAQGWGVVDGLLTILFFSLL